MACGIWIIFSDTFTFSHWDFITFVDDKFEFLWYIHLISRILISFVLIMTDFYLSSKFNQLFNENYDIMSKQFKFRSMSSN